MRGGSLVLALGHAHRWNADAIACLHASRALHAAAIHPHLAAAQDAVDMALGHALQAGHEEIIEALAGLLLGHVDPAHFAIG